MVTRAIMSRCLDRLVTDPKDERSHRQGAAVTFNPDSDLQREVAGQPDDWAGVVARLPELADALPAAGARVAVVGCGTSYFMAQAYAALREQSGHGETDAFAASEHRLDRSYDAVLVITRSGTTTEVIDVLTSLRGRDRRHDGDRRHTRYAGHRAGRPDHPAARGRREVGRADPVRHLHRGAAPGVTRRGPVGRDRRRPGRAGRGRGAVPGRRGRRRAGDLRRSRLDHRAGRGGRPQAARVGPVLDRVLPGDGVPARPGEHRHRGPGRLGARRGAAGPGGAGARHRCALREPGHRPARRAGAGAPALPGEGPAGRPRPRPPAAPHPVGGPAGGHLAE